MFKRLVVVSILAVAVFSTAWSQQATYKPKVLQRVKLGSYIEDLTYVTAGSYTGSLIVLDGYGIYASHKAAPFSKLFDLRDNVPILGRINGIAYAESRDLLVINDRAQLGKLFLCDFKGKLRGTIAIQYPAADQATLFANEGMTYIPANAPMYQGAIVRVTEFQSAARETSQRLDIIGMDGHLLASLDPPVTEAEGGYIGSVTYVAPGHLLVGGGKPDGTQAIWTMDLLGNVAAVQDVPELHGFLEGLATAGDAIVGSQGFGGLLYFNLQLQRLPALDRPYEMGLGVGIIVAWDGNHKRFLFHRLTDVAHIAEVYAAPPNLKSKVRLFDLGSSGLPPGLTQRITYLPDEDLIALTHHKYVSPPLSPPLSIPPSIQLFNTSGTRVDELDLSSLGNNPTRIRYILSQRYGKKFAIRFSGTGPATTFHILERDGTLDHAIDLSPTGIDGILALAYFAPSDPSGGRFMVTAGSYRALVTDYTGSEIGEFDYRKALNVIQPADVEAITSGPYAGTFCMTEINEAEMVVFSLQ